MDKENIKLDNYWEFMNENVFKPIGTDIRELIQRGWALQAPQD